MNILIADSGSSKTDWCFIRGQHEPARVQTPGLNPYFLDHDGIESVLLKELAPYIYFDKVDELFFYGAGLGSEANRARLDEVFSTHFHNAVIHLETDMLGAARGLFGKGSGIACIAGTGSNGCFYRDEKIVTQLPALGYILGDEGSATHLGKELVKHWLTDSLPDDLASLLNAQFPYSRAQVLDKVYRQPHPNIFLAGFSPFIEKNIQHPFLENLVIASFSSMLQQTVMKVAKYSQFHTGFCGSVAYHFRDQLLKAAAPLGITIQTIMQNPMEGLLRYHSEAL